MERRTAESPGQFSRYLRTRERGAWTAIFHELHPKPWFVLTDVWRALRVSSVALPPLVVSELRQRGLLISSTAQDDEALMYAKDQLGRRLDRASVLYLVLIQGCNFSCSYCPIPVLSTIAGLCAEVGMKAGLRTHRRGTVVVIQRPRFSTRAESRWFTRQGWSLVNMTQHPECSLAREFGLCYATMAMITDYDVGVGRRRARFASDASARPVLEVFRRNVTALEDLLVTAATQLPLDGLCGCERPLPPEYYKTREQGEIEVGETA